MIVYLETTSLLKLYFDDESSAAIRSLIEDASIVATSVLSYTEVAAFFARQHHDGYINARALATLKGALEQDWPHFLGIEVSEQVLRRADTRS